MNRVFVVLGSNINKEENLPLAVRLLSKVCRVVAVSSVYETIPVGLRDQPNFFNVAILLETEMEASALKEEVLSEIERRLQRQRTANRNAPRTIDADIVLFNDEVFDYGGAGGHQRHVPDPDLLNFAHVAVPVAELVPDLPHPETDEPLASVAARLMVTATEDGRPPLWKRPDISLLLEGEDSFVKRKT
ncbi:MAG TPA: 2-amino-4-hydroxy-6-hydroxymethyldihydropteridine diphosphokinase [Anaerolineae bacterium]